MLGQDPNVVEGIEKDGDSSSDAPSRTGKEKEMEANTPVNVAAPEVRE